MKRKKLCLIQSKETSIVHLQEWIKINVFIWYYTKVNYIIKILKIGLLSFLNKILIFCLQNWKWVINPIYIYHVTKCKFEGVKIVYTSIFLKTILKLLLFLCKPIKILLFI